MRHVLKLISKLQTSGEGLLQEAEGHVAPCPTSFTRNGRPGGECRLSHAGSSSCASCGMLQDVEWMLYFTVVVHPVVGRICPHESPWGGGAFLLAGFRVLGMGRSGNGISNEP